MIERLAHIARPVLDTPIIRRTRRNHGLEHATITLLSGRIKGARLAGRSNDSGFLIVGDVPTEQVDSAAREALRRMRNGERHLALHPGCGTNLLTTGALTTTVGFFCFAGTHRKPMFERFPVVLLLMMFAVLFSQPLGMSLQKHFTTEGDPGDLEIVGVTRREMRVPFGTGTVTVHRVDTRGG